MSGFSVVPFLIHGFSVDDNSFNMGGLAVVSFLIGVSIVGSFVAFTFGIEISDRGSFCLLWNRKMKPNVALKIMRKPTHQENTMLQRLM